MGWSSEEGVLVHAHEVGEVETLFERHHSLFIPLFVIHAQLQIQFASGPVIKLQAGGLAGNAIAYEISAFELQQKSFDAVMDLRVVRECDLR